MDKIWYKWWIIPVRYKCDEINIHDKFTYCYKGEKIKLIATKDIIVIKTKGE